MAGLKVDPKVAAPPTRFLDMVAEDRIGSCYGYTYGGKRPYLDINTGDCRDDADRVAVPDVHRLGAQTARFGTGRGTSEILGPSRQRHVLLLLRHPSHASLRRLFVEKWNSFMRDYLVQSQSQQGSELGSWMLDGSHDESGRLYCTAMAAMTLEVYYRYASIYSKESVTTGPRR